MQAVALREQRRALGGEAVSMGRMLRLVADQAKKPCDKATGALLAIEGDDAVWAIMCARPSFSRALRISQATICCCMHALQVARSASGYTCCCAPMMTCRVRWLVTCRRLWRAGQPEPGAAARAARVHAAARLGQAARGAQGYCHHAEGGAGAGAQGSSLGGDIEHERIVRSRGASAVCCAWDCRQEPEAVTLSAELFRLVCPAGWACVPSMAWMSLCWVE
jgi:hypothetical protein